MNTNRLWMLSLCVATATACVGAPDNTPDHAETSSTALTTTFQGSLSATGTSWVTHTLQVTEPGTVNLSLDWANAGADLNLFFYDADGMLVAHQNGTTAKPEALSFHVDTAGTYQIGIKCKTGSTAYTLDADFTADAVVHEFTGTAAANAWITKTFEAEAGQPIDATLSWATHSANLNLFLYDPSGALVVFANGTTANPEHVSTVATATGTWQVAIKAKTGSSAYDLKVLVGPGASDPDDHDYPGRAAPGTLAWGAAISGNGDPVARHENAAGHPLTLRRTYYQWGQRTTAMINTANDDAAHGRLPWVSVKPPSWSEMAAGTHDGEIDSMLTALDNVDGPVWLTIHHEPEGGGGVNHPDDPGGPSAHIEMNRRVRERMTALGVDNVALAPILMSYDWQSSSGRNPEDWWAPGIYDFLGVDIYQPSQASMLTPTWFEIRDFAESKGVELAVGEWGMHGTDAASGARMHEFYDEAANSDHDGQGARVTGLAYFDSNLNSSDGGWELKGAQLTTFRELLNDPRTADPQ